MIHYAAEARPERSIIRCSTSVDNQVTVRDAISSMLIRFNYWFPTDAGILSFRLHWQFPARLMTNPSFPAQPVFTTLKRCSASYSPRCNPSKAFLHRQFISRTFPLRHVRIVLFVSSASFMATSQRSSTKRWLISPGFSRSHAIFRKSYRRRTEQW